MMKYVVQSNFTYQDGCFESDFSFYSSRSDALEYIANTKEICQVDDEFSQFSFSLYRLELEVYDE